MRCEPFRMGLTAVGRRIRPTMLTLMRKRDRKRTEPLVIRCGLSDPFGTRVMDMNRTKAALLWIFKLSRGRAD
jgi:hypothetical protein